MKFLTRLARIISLALLLAAPAGMAQEQVTEMPFFLTFVPNVQFSPLYVAIEKGYFAAAGFNFVPQHGDEPDGVNLIAADQIKFGFISGEQVILARANDRPLVFVYEWFQEFPVGVVVPDDSDIDTVDALAGRKVGIPGRFGASYSGLVALLSAAGMTEDDIQLEPIGFNAPEVVCMGGVEASVIYVNNEPLQIQRRAEAGDCGSIRGVRVIPVASMVDMISNGIVTNATTIENDPQLVRAVVSGFDRALRDVINNPADAFLLSSSYVEGLADGELAEALAAEAAYQAEFLAGHHDREAVAESRAAMRARLNEQFGGDALVQFDVLLNTIDLWDADRLGLTNLEAWETTQDVLLLMGFLEAPIDLTEAFTNAFVEQLEG